MHTHRSLLTRHEYDNFKAQLNELRRVRDRDLPQLLRDARGFVANDAAEEMLQIQGDQAVVDARIAHFEALLRNAHVVDDSEWNPGAIIPGRIAPCATAAAAARSRSWSGPRPSKARNRYRSICPAGGSRR